MATTTRTMILDKALNLFARKGYSSTGIQEVAQAAQVTKPTIYHYFQSKNGLLSSLLEESLTPLLEELEAGEYTGNIKQNLLAIGEMIFSFVRSNADVYRFFLACMFASPESEELHASMPLAQRQFLAIDNMFKYVSSLELEPYMHESLHAALFQGILHNYVTLYFHGHIVLDEATVMQLVAVYLHGIME